MWRFQNFSVTQIFREIKIFSDFKMSKSAFLALSETLNLNFVDFRLLKLHRFDKNQHLEPLKLSRMAVFETL